MKRLVPIFFIIFLGSTLLSCTAPIEATPSPTPIPVPTPTPLPVQIEGLEETTLRTICISVEQSYPQIEEGFIQSIEETISRILGNIGVNTCEQGMPCDASLNIDLVIEAIEDEYIVYGKCFAEAKAEGQMTLSIPDHEPINMPIQGYKISYAIRYCPKNPSDAPLAKAWIQALLSGFYEVWSIQVLSAALRDQDGDINYAALKVLEDLGPDAAGAVPALITCISNEEMDYRYNAIQALEAIGPPAIEAVPALVEILNNECIDYGSGAADAISAMKTQDEEVVQALTQCLEIILSYDIIDALKEIGPAAVSSVPVLINRFEEGKDYQNKRILEALQAITGQDFGPSADQWMAWWEEQQ